MTDNLPWIQKEAMETGKQLGICSSAVSWTYFCLGKANTDLNVED